MGRKDEFERAFAVATVHDFFNYIAVLIFLPLELATGYLQKSATWLASTFSGYGGVEYDSPLKGALKAVQGPIKDAIGSLAGSERAQGIILVLVSAALIYFALMLLVKVMRGAMHSRVEGIVNRGIYQNALVAMAIGIVVTVMVQSSSITTSLLVPLAGAGLITLEQAFPITIGANIGTTVTAFLAALAVTGPNAIHGVEIACVHLLFNLSATLVIYPFQRIRQIPLRAARSLAKLAVRSRTLAIAYVVVLFYGVPAVFAIINRALN
jgi:sodium-dependent phosphate cotransporter